MLQSHNVYSKAHAQRQQFFALRILLGFICSFCEASFYRGIVEGVNERVGRYVLFSLLLSAGMWSASTGKLPPIEGGLTRKLMDSLPTVKFRHVHHYACLRGLVPPCYVDTHGRSTRYKGYYLFRSGCNHWMAIHRRAGTSFCL